MPPIQSTINRKLVNAGQLTRQYCSLMASAPDGYLTGELIDKGFNNPPANARTLRRWGLAFQSEWLVQCSLITGHKERMRLYRLSAESIELLNTGIAQVEAAGL